MGPKRYSSVSKMLHELSGDDDFNKEFDELVSKQRILKNLISLRCAKNVSQSEVAAALNVTQSRVSKIENGIDDDLKFGELRAYAETCGMDVEILFRGRETTIADQVKFHVFRVKHLLDRLAGCAERDEGIAKGVATFFGEAFFSVVKLMQDSVSKLPTRKVDGRPHICIQIQEMPFHEVDSAGRDCDVCNCEEEGNVPASADV